MTKSFKTIGATAITGLLAACGGGGEGGGPRTVFTYQEFTSTVPGESRVAAAGLTRTATNAPAEGTEVVLGTLDRETRLLTVTLDTGGAISGTYDADTQTWTDGTTTVGNYAGLTGNFDFILPVEVSANGESNPYIIGVISRTEDISRVAGITSYSGTAQVDALISADGVATPAFFNSGGNLDMQARFSNNHVTAIISGLTGMPFDTIELRNLQISGGADATFTFDAGSTILFTSGGDAFTPQIGTATTSADGAFFGGDTLGPLEAGGAFAVDGETGNIWGIFAADDRGNTP